MTLETATRLTSNRARGRHRIIQSLSKMDGRCSVAQRIKTVARRLKAEIDLRGRWSNAALDDLQRTATAIVMAEEAQRLALQGAVPFADATKAAGHARRAQRDLRAKVLSKEFDLLTLDEMLAS